MPLGGALSRIGDPELGYLVCCNADHSMIAAYNPRLTLHRTKTIMQGDDHCDHCFHWSEEESMTNLGSGILSGHYWTGGHLQLHQCRFGHGSGEGLGFGKVQHQLDGEGASCSTSS